MGEAQTSRDVHPSQGNLVRVVHELEGRTIEVGGIRPPKYNRRRTRPNTKLPQIDPTGRVIWISHIREREIVVIIPEVIAEAERQRHTVSEVHALSHEVRHVGGIVECTRGLLRVDDHLPLLREVDVQHVALVHRTRWQCHLEAKL